MSLQSPTELPGLLWLPLISLHEAYTSEENTHLSQICYVVYGDKSYLTCQYRPPPRLKKWDPGQTPLIFLLYEKHTQGGGKKYVYVTQTASNMDLLS